MDKQEEKLAEVAIDKYKYLLLLIGIPLLIAFIRTLLVDMLVKDARRIGNQAQATDDELAKREAQARATANEIIQRVSEQLDKKPVDENWNK